RRPGPVSLALSAAALVSAAALSCAAEKDMPATIEQVKRSIVAIGSFERTRNPAFSFAGTGFAVGNGLQIATNEHVLPKTLNTERNETLAIALRAPDGSVQIRPARKLAADPAHDLALLEVQGTPLPPLRPGDSTLVR